MAEFDDDFDAPPHAPHIGAFWQPRNGSEAARNFAILRRITQYLLKSEKTTKLGIAAKRLKAGWNKDYLATVPGMTS